MGLRIHPRRLFGTRLVTLTMALALVTQPMYGVLAAQTANAAEPPLIVDATCVDQKAVLTATFTESTPGWQGGKVWYDSDYGSTPVWAPQNIPAGDIDTWTRPTGQTSIAAGAVTVRVSGLVAVEKTGWFGVKYTILEAYNKTLDPAEYADINCDSTAPSTPVVSALASHYNSPVDVSWSSATDNHSGIGSYEVSYRYADGTDVVAPISVIGTTHTFAGSESTQSTIFVSVVAIDGNGNRSAESAPVQFIYDSEAPNVEINSLSDGQHIRGASVPVSITVNDSNLEALSYRITNLQTGKNIVEKSFNSVEGLNKSLVFNWETNQKNDPNYADGRYSIYVSGRDALQQRSEVRITVIVDNEKPSNYNASINGESFVGKIMGGTKKFDVTYFDQNPDTLHMEYQKLVSGKWQKFTQGYAYSTHIGSLTVNTATSGWEDGVYQIKANGNDIAGNKSSATFGFTVDNTKPELNMPVEKAIGGKYTFELSQEEAHPDRTYVEFMIQQGSNKWEKVSGKWYEGNNFEYTIDTTVAKINNATAHQLKVSTWDQANNHSSAAHQFTVDNNKPSNYAATTNDEEFVGKTLRGLIRFDVTQNEDNPSRMYIEYNHLVDGKIKKYTGKYFYDTNEGYLDVDTSRWADGSYQLKVSSRDDFKNESSKTFKFSVDNTSPEVDVRGYTATLDSITISGVTNDPGAEVFVTLDEQRVLAITNHEGEWQVKFSDLTPGTIYNYIVQSEDAAGNKYTSPEAGEGMLQAQTSALATEDDKENPSNPGGDQPGAGAPALAVGSAEAVYTSTSSIPGATTPLGSAFAAAFTTPVIASSPASEAAVLGDQDVLGTTDTAAPSATASDEADDTEESNGLAWYWWLIIAAAGIGAFWWIIAAVRKSNDEE